MIRVVSPSKCSNFRKFPVYLWLSQFLNSPWPSFVSCFCFPGHWELLPKMMNEKLYVWRKGQQWAVSEPLADRRHQKKQISRKWTSISAVHYVQNFKWRPVVKVKIEISPVIYLLEWNKANNNCEQLLKISKSEEYSLKWLGTFRLFVMIVT